MTEEGNEAVRSEHPAEVDLWSVDFNEHFWERVGELQRDDPVAMHMQGQTPCWYVTRYDDVWEVLRDWRTFSSTEGVAILGHDNRSEPPKNEGRFVPEDLDPPAHGEWRRVMNADLTVEKVARFEPIVREMAGGLLDDLTPRGRFQMMEEFLRPLQLRATFGHLLRLPTDQMDQWVTWGHDIFVAPTPAEAEAAYMGMYQGVQELIIERREHPLADDLVSNVVRAKIAGEEPDMSTLIAAVMPLAIAGLESNGTILGGTIHHLATHPDLRDELVQDPSLIPLAVEEGLRMFANVTALQRTVTKPTVIAGHSFQPGDKVWPSYNAANRDPAQFEQPHEWNLHRDANRHVAFSVGPHRCPGSNLARTMVQATLEIVLERIPDLVLAPGEEVTYHSMPTRGIHEFTVSFTPTTVGAI